MVNVIRAATLAGVWLAIGVDGWAIAQPPPSPEEKAVAYLAAHAAAWPKENGCFSCHNNGDAARALYAAKRQGLSFPADALRDTTAWLQKPDGWADNKGSPEFSDQRLADLQFAFALVAAIESGAAEKEPLDRAAALGAAAQAEDGAWRFDAAEAVGSPITYGTFLATAAARRVLSTADAHKYEERLARADHWLRAAPVKRVLDAAAVMWAIAGNSNAKAGERLDDCRAMMLGGQAADGGWGPYVTSPPEPFDTALVVLAIAAAKDERLAKPLGRGRAYLLSTQLEDGSWPATTRPPRGESYSQKISTSAWATLALLATSPRARSGDEQENDQRD
jgi:hypothetical protein